MATVTLSLAEIFEDAFDAAGAELRTGHDLRIGRRALTMLMDEWANRGLNLWTVEQSSLSCTAGTSDYTLDSDTVDIIDAVIRSTDGETDYLLTRIGVGTYAGYTDKAQQGRPSVFYVQRITAPKVTLWQVPDKAYTFVYWKLRRLESISSGIAGSADMPSRFIPALTAGIAVRINRQKKGGDRLADLIPEYERQFGLAYDEDRDRASYHMTPGGHR